MYRFDPNDKQREQLKNTVLYYSDFGFEFTFKLDGQELSTFVAGPLSANAILPIDRDKNGQVSRRYEVAKIGYPFNFTGSTYLFSFKEGKLTLDVASEKLEQAPMPPDLRLGKKALSFAAKTMEGAEVEFPKSFAGKVVMLDCWATWCGPCIAEIPNMKQAYEDWHDKGFEILGVSFDDEGKEDDIRKFLSSKELPWPQIYEGKGWETSIGIQHDVSGIPFVLLVDGDSGEILGTSRQLRGPKLTEFIGEQLEKKGSAK
jgi:thiol-disulfide isomerase/thioredoxin